MNELTSRLVNEFNVNLGKDTAHFEKDWIKNEHLSHQLPRSSWSVGKAGLRTK